MLEGFQERQALEMSHVSHMHQHPPSLPSGSAGDGQHPPHDTCTSVITLSGVSGSPPASETLPQQLPGQLHRRQGARMGCLLLNQTLSAKVLQEGRKERGGTAWGLSTRRAETAA